MKIKKKIPLSLLLEYHFSEVTPKDKKDINSPFWEVDYYYEMGHFRREQYYYILVKESDRSLNILATKPDGSGGPVTLPDVLIELFKDGVL